MSAENIALVGADPEMFVQKMVTDHRGRPLRMEDVPAFGLFGGNKDEPIQMEGLADGFKYLEDNAALEINIPPASTGEEFASNIHNAKDWLSAHLMEPNDLGFSDNKTMVLNAKYLSDPRAKEIGCLPDNDAYKHGMARPPLTAESLGNARHAAGHIHVAYNHKVIPQYVAARMLDLYLQLPWLEYDLQPQRRKIYGQAGIFRPKSYGIEYRTPSNWWLWHGKGTIVQFIEGALYFARNSYNADYLHRLSEAYAGMPWDDVKSCIEREDAGTAYRLIDLADEMYGLGIRRRRRVML